MEALVWIYNTKYVPLQRYSLHFILRIYKPGNCPHAIDRLSSSYTCPCICTDFFASERCGCNFNTLRPRQNGRHFADDIFKYIFLSENVWIPIEISLKFVPKGLIDNIPSLVQIMAWRRPGDKPLSEPMIVSLSMHICVTRLQCVW